MADYMVLNDTRERGRSVSRNFEMYQFYEKENKPNSKCGFKTNKLLTAVKETDHTITTSEGRVIHKKLASKPLKFQTSRRTEEQIRAITRCRKCGKFSHGEFCETHQRQDLNNNTHDSDPSTSHTLPTMPAKKKYNRVVMYDSSSRESNRTDASVGEDSSNTEEEPEKTDLRDEIGREIERLRDQTPTLTTPIGCSTEPANNQPRPNHSGTPIRHQQADDTNEPEEAPTGKPRSKQKIDIGKSQIKFKSEPRRSERIRSARRVVKLGGVEYF